MKLNFNIIKFIINVKINTLSLIIPVFNEEKTIRTILKKVIEAKLPNGIKKEIIIVDDGSSDNTFEKIHELLTKNNASKLNIKIFKHQINQGKGAAVRTAIQASTGDYLIIQDADLEYDPFQISKLVKELDREKIEVVYGTRINRLPNFKKEESKFQFFLHYLGNRFLSFLTSLLYGQWLTDMETGYKLFPKKAIVDMQIDARGFEFEPEITAKLLKRGYHIHEVPITTTPRSYEEGKKLNTITDGLKAVSTLFKYRFS